MKYGYFNRDISWLSFNYRVLEEAYDDSLPLYERIKFLAIYSNNLEEFYRVRVSYYRSLIRDLPDNHPKLKVVKPESVLREINRIVSIHQTEFHKLFNDSIIPELEKNGIHLLEYNDQLTEDQKNAVKTIFKHEILTAIQPVLLVKKRIRPFLKTGNVYLVVRLYTRSRTIRNYKRGARPHYALIKLPTDHGVSRFIEVESEDDNYYIMFLEDVIMSNLQMVLPGYHIDNWFSIKVTRDADLEYEDYDGEDLIEVIENIETTRAIGEPNRFQYDGSMPKNMLNFLVETFDIDERNLVKGGRTHNFRDFFRFPNPKSPELEHPKFTPLRVQGLEEASYIFEAIREKEYLLHFPYQTFDYFINFLQEAATNPDVEEIQTTQYRVASKSAVVDALMTAALNGKKVTVFVELKARFDEENNLQNARAMKQAGINIIYSIPGLKVHSKLAMVTKRQDEHGNKERFAFLGTGNFNEKTAKLYGDHGFFTTDTKLTDELINLFKYLEDQNYQTHFNHLLVPNINMVETFTKLIKQEITNVQKGNNGYICLKMNGLEDPVMIDELYNASVNGVKIDLIVRGICRVIPEKAYSRNIRVIRIVDRFLEHARVFLFYNNGENRLYLGSADWMRRNLYRRIECDFPIYDPHLKQEIIDILNIQLQDNLKARLINQEMENSHIPVNNKPLQSQVAIYEYLKNKNTPAGL
jgi:polyphosphate kinase